MTMISHGVEVSIAGGVEMMVHDPTSRRPRHPVIKRPSPNPNPVLLILRVIRLMTHNES